METAHLDPTPGSLKKENGEFEIRGKTTLNTLFDRSSLAWHTKFNGKRENVLVNSYTKAK